METRKQAILDAIAAFIRQRPGMDPRNYGDARSYRAESRAITRDKHDAEILLQVVRGRDSITADSLIEAQRAYSGRLTIVESSAICSDCGGCGVTDLPLTDTDAERDRVTCLRCDGAAQVPATRIEYCTGQYFPTEYRKAACAVLAAALWDWQRENMPKGVLMHNSETGETRERYEGLTAGTWLRRKFRQEFGSRLQRRWFD